MVAGSTAAHERTSNCLPYLGASSTGRLAAGSRQPGRRAAALPRSADPRCHDRLPPGRSCSRSPRWRTSRAREPPRAPNLSEPNGAGPDLSLFGATRRADPCRSPADATVGSLASRETGSYASPMARGEWDVFVSYSHDDAEWVEVLASNLYHAGLAVFLDVWELASGGPVRRAPRRGDTAVGQWGPRGRANLTEATVDTRGIRGAFTTVGQTPGTAADPCSVRGC